jgi:hypothetical protein
MTTATRCTSGAGVRTAQAARGGGAEEMELRLVLRVSSIVFRIEWFVNGDELG